MREVRPFGRPKAALGVGLAACTVLAACGTRLPEEAFESERRVVTVADGELGASTEVGATAPGEATPGPGAEGASAATPTDGAGAPDSPDGTGGGDPDGPSGDQGSAARGPNQASDVGVTETTIRVGSIVAEHGVVGDAFAPAVRGLRAWVAATNAAGGIGGRSIELFTCDDREDRSRSLECARRLVERDQVFALLAVNTRSFGGAAQYLHDQGVPVYGFPINNAMYRYPRMFSIYYGSYPRDGQTVGFEGQVRYTSAVPRWFKEEMGATKVGAIFYDIAESRQAGESFAKGFELEGFEVTRYMVSFAAPSFDQPVADMQRRGVQVVIDGLDDGANRRLCDAMARRGFTPEAKLTTVVGVDARIGQNYNETCRNRIFSNGPGRSFTDNHPEVARFRDAFAQFQPGLPLHQWALEAWAIGNIFADALEAMGPAPTRDGFVDFLNSMPPNDARGIMVYPRSYQVPPYPQDRAEECFHMLRWLDDRGGWTSASAQPHCVPDARVYYTPALEQGN